MLEDWNSTTIEKCVLELVLNSLNAKATAIAVRINTRNRKLQVVDNGFGISKNALRYIGENSTNEDKSTASNKTNLFESERNIAGVRDISSVLIIISRHVASTETYGKFFSDNRTSHLASVANRPTHGTTVTVYASNESCNSLNEIDSFRIRCIIVFLALVNTQVSFSVRDDTRGSILLRIGKHQKRAQLLRVVCERPVNSKRIRSIRIRILDKIKIVGFWGFDCTRSRKIHQILLNLRPVRCTELESFIIEWVSNIYDTRTENEPVSLEKIFFLIYIDSPDSMYNLSMKNGRFTLEFDRIDMILRSIKKSLRITRSKESKPFGVSIRQPIVPPLICRPIGRILGLKRKQTFLTNVERHSFENGTIRGKNESRARDSIKNDPRHCSDDSESHKEESNNSEALMARKGLEYDKNDISLSSGQLICKPIRDIDIPISRSESSDPLLPVKIFERNDLAAFCGRIERSKSDTDEATWKTKNSNETPIGNVDESDNVDASRMSDKLVEKSQSAVAHPRVLQKIDRNLSEEEGYRYDNDGVLWITQKCVEKLSCGGEEIYTISDCSQWSDWIYEPKNTRNCNEIRQPKTARSTIVRRFRFLPLKLHALLQFGDVKFISKASLQDDGGIHEILNENFNFRRQDLDVRLCARRAFEVRLKVESLRSMKVLNQVNREFIVAQTKQDGKRLLVIIDQHAMDERIRYENLLRAYRRDKKNQQFISVTLHRPIVISDFSPIACSLLASNQRLLYQYGVSLGHRNDNTLLIFTVPRCFSKKAYRADNTDIDRVVRKLLQEVLDNLNGKGAVKFLPSTIHDAIASEACHGAIKFGDPLTIGQCESLVSCWKQTEAPNRCAHGRPSVIPLMELSSLKYNYQHPTSQEKLNFASLRNSRESSGKIRVRTARYHPYNERTVQYIGEI